MCSVRYRYSRVLMSYRSYRSVRYRYWCTEITEVSGTGIKVYTGIGGTGIHVVPNLPKCLVPVLLSYRTYQSVRYRYRCRTEVTEVSGTGIDIVPNLPKCPVPVLMSYRTYRSVRCRYLRRTNLPKCPVPVLTSYQFTEVSGTGIDVPKLPKCPVPVLMYRTYRSVRYRYWCRTEVTEASGTGIDIVPNLPTCSVPVLMLYRTYRSVRYRYWCCTELTEVSGTGMNVCTGTDGTGIHVVPNLPKCPVPVLMSYRTYRSVRYR